MLRIKPIFTREIEEEKASLLRVPQAIGTPYPFKAESTYIPPEAPPSVRASQQETPRARTGLWNSIALRFGGFSAELRAVVEPLRGVQRASIARNFFANRLHEAVALAAKHPEAALRLIAETTKGAAPIWQSLLLVACGDGSALAAALGAIEDAHALDELALADCIAMVARVQPREGRHLVRHAVRYVGTRAQLRMLGALVDSQAPESKRLLGDLFETMMERSTAAERRNEIYPAITRIASEDVGRKSPGRGLLGALLRGWLSEAPAIERDPLART